RGRTSVFLLLLSGDAIASHRRSYARERPDDRSDCGRRDWFGRGRSCPVVGWQVGPVVGSVRAGWRQRGGRLVMVEPQSPLTGDLFGLGARMITGIVAWALYCEP